MIFDTMELTLQETENTMALYTIIATRTISYDFNINADSEEEALQEMRRIDLSENAEDYAYEWGSLQVFEINKETK